MTSHDARPSGCTPFEEELVNVLKNYADSADTPAFDAPGIVRRTRRRRNAGIAAVAAVLILGGGGTALATSVAGGSHSTPSRSTEAENHDAATVLYGIDADSGRPLPIDFHGWDLRGFNAYMSKMQTKLGTVSERPVTGCKPGSVIAVSPHTPKVVKSGDTISVVLCAGGR
ncbi:hypothetical protein [Streptomyces venetus]|uniref:hypothetical protein n=1 Tax=Streptomyces venetus TaxID=1701086 RepID=UPI003C2D2C08